MAVALLMIARFLLLLDGLIFIFVGYTLFSQPMRMENLGFILDQPVAITAIRTWGGFFVALGATAVFSAIIRRYLSYGLCVLILFSACIVAARWYGIQVDGEQDKQFSELTSESSGLLIAVMAALFYYISLLVEKKEATFSHH